MKKIAILAGAALLASCGSSDEGTFETEDGEVTYTVDGDGNEAEIVFQGEDGERMEINTGSDAGSVLPDGFDIYPGAEVVTSTTITQNDGSGAMVLLQSNASPSDMVEYYRGQAEAAGIEIQMEANVNGSFIIGGEGEGGKTFSFNASPNGDGTSGQLIVGQGLN